MSGVCKALRDRCRSDYFLDKHMKQKWDRVIGPSAYKVWRLCPASRRDNGDSNQGMQKGLLRLFSLVWPRSWAGEKINIGQDQTWSLPHDSSVMSQYIALETGSLWFPAQVYNRENGDARFMLSCYDAVLSYDFRTDAFTARYPPYGRRAIELETGVTWEKLRSPPVDTSPHDLHPSDCLKDLCPGDHVEIQWKRNKKLPTVGGTASSVIWNRVTGTKITVVVLAAMLWFWNLISIQQGRGTEMAVKVGLRGLAWLSIFTGLTLLAKSAPLGSANASFVCLCKDTTKSTIG
ncbi:hypothetical protein NL676_031342 [Syzygium grande]|nr:hypothetical protein NL676_031342 [Syzygium grande]